MVEENSPISITGARIIHLSKLTFAKFDAVPLVCKCFLVKLCFEINF